MNREEKAAVIDRLAEELEQSQAVFAVDYRGITVSQVATLRAKLREADTTFRVVKNSLTERAADKAGAEALKSVLQGPTALAFVRGDAAAAAKALSDAGRLTDVLAFKGGLMDGQVVGPDDIRAIAKLPSREVLYAQLVGMVATPLTGLARTLNALIAGVAIQLRAIHDQGLVGGSAAPAEPAAPAEAAPEGETEAAPEAEPAPEADAAEAPAETAEEPAADSNDTDSNTTENQTDAAADADEASDAKED